MLALQIANIGFMEVNDHELLKAVASDTLFIHGSLTGGGGSMFKAVGAAPVGSTALALSRSNRANEGCTSLCGIPSSRAVQTVSDGEGRKSSAATFGISTVCDRSCYADSERGPRFGGHLCGAGNTTQFGAHCRTCYNDLEEARAAEILLAEQERIELERRAEEAQFQNGERRALRVFEVNRHIGRDDEGDEEKGYGEGVVNAGAAKHGEGMEKDEDWRVREPSRGVKRSEEHDHAVDDNMIAERRRHVIMCDTLMPPPASPDCSLKCQKKDDTVCDRSCGTGRFGDYNCNWRGYGANCRFCFNDREKALLANDAAKQRGGSVIMCDTFEPPTEHDNSMPPITVGDDDSIVGEVGKDDTVASAADEQEKTSLKELTALDSSVDPPDEPYVKGIKRGQICAFMSGFSFFVMETKVAVESILHFMPGMRIAIATHAEEVSLFQRTMEGLPGVRVSEAVSPINLAPLLADRYCGEGTELILYMNPGELLSRKFTSKDTHSTAGDLLVVYAEVDRIGEANMARVLATMSVLGFSSPSFSFGTDVLLPVDSNQQLRDVLLSDTTAFDRKDRTSTDRDLQAVRALDKFNDVFVPEVLAALVYARNPPGVWFVNPQQWVMRHMFEPASIWDIPLVKPRFGCAFDMSMAVQGYDMAAALDDQLRHFMSGTACDLGFIHIPHTHLIPKANIEFGFPTGRQMPSITEARLRVSVVFFAGRQVSPTLLDASISSVAARFPEAAEVVVVFVEASAARDDVLSVLDAHARDAPFPVEAIEDNVSPLSPRGGWPGWSGLGVDDIASGEFVVQLEVGDILIEDMTYDNIFHFRKPVIPFLRLSVDGGDTSNLSEDKANAYEDRYIACGIESVIEMDAVRDFALLRGLVYPRAAYSEMRIFAREVHHMEIDDLVEHAHKSCEGIKTADGSPVGPKTPPANAPWPTGLREEINSLDDAKTKDLPTMAFLAMDAPVVLHKQPQFVLLGVCNNSDGIIRCIMRGMELDPREDFLANPTPGYFVVKLRYAPLRVLVYIKTADEAGLHLEGLDRGGVIAIAPVEKDFTTDLNQPPDKDILALVNYLEQLARETLKLFLDRPSTFTPTSVTVEMPSAAKG
eukprot:g7869.t1